MDRKKFLSLTKKAVVTSSVGGLVLSQKAFGQGVDEIITDYTCEDESGGNNYKYSFGLNDKCLSKTATDDMKSFVLHVARWNYVKNAQGEKEIKNLISVDFKIDIINVRENADILTNKGGSMLLDCVKGSCVKGDVIETPLFPKRFSISPLDNYTNLLVTDESGEFIAAMNNAESDFYDNCFLTSACVGALHLSDNCYELETLRSFRDEYISSLSLGQQVIDEYYLVGPRIVAEINRQRDAKELYKHIYSTLVIPSVTLIEQNKKEEAFAFYKNYVSILSETVFA